MYKITGIIYHLNLFIEEQQERIIINCVHLNLINFEKILKVK